MPRADGEAMVFNGLNILDVNRIDAIDNSWMWTDRHITLNGAKIVAI